MCYSEYCLTCWRFISSLLPVLPGIAGEGMSIVISPLLALMNDQMEILKAAKIGVATINSRMADAERLVVEEALKDQKGPCYKFLYLTPEQCAVPRTQNIIRNLGKNGFLRTFIIDEAHCISGETFFVFSNLIFFTILLFQSGVSWNIGF